MSGRNWVFPVTCRPVSECSARFAPPRRNRDAMQRCASSPRGTTELHEHGGRAAGAACSGFVARSALTARSSYPENETLLHRENIYGSGPPMEEPGVEVSNLLREYLPERASVVDVGCGAGAYGPGLMAAGHDWLGLEANAHCCDLLLRRQLPFRRVDLESRESALRRRRMGLRNLHRGARAHERPGGISS